MHIIYLFTEAVMLKIASKYFLRLIVIRRLHSLNAYQSFKNLAVGPCTLDTFFIKGGR